MNALREEKELLECNSCIYSIATKEKNVKCKLGNMPKEKCYDYESVEDFLICDCCNELVNRDKIYFIGKERICEECVENGYG